MHFLQSENFPAAKNHLAAPDDGFRFPPLPLGKRFHAPHFTRKIRRAADFSGDFHHIQAKRPPGVPQDEMPGGRLAPPNGLPLRRGVRRLCRSRRRCIKAVRSIGPGTSVEGLGSSIFTAPRLPGKRKRRIRIQPFQRNEFPAPLRAQRETYPLRPDDTGRRNVRRGVGGRRRRRSSGGASCQEKNENKGKQKVFGYAHHVFFSRGKSKAEPCIPTGQASRSPTYSPRPHRGRGQKGKHPRERVTQLPQADQDLTGLGDL